MKQSQIMHSILVSSSLWLFKVYMQLEFIIISIIIITSIVIINAVVMNNNSLVTWAAWNSFESIYLNDALYTHEYTLVWRQHLPPVLCLILISRQPLCFFSRQDGCRNVLAMSSNLQLTSDLQIGSNLWMQRHSYSSVSHAVLKNKNRERVHVSQREIINLSHFEGCSVIGVILLVW